MAQPIFRAILEGDHSMVVSLLEKKPALLGARLSGSPAKHQGVSPLQLAICVRQYAIAEWLIPSGADVNYVDPTLRSGWAVPVLHDAVISSVFSSIKERSRLPVEQARRTSDAAFEVLSLLLENGASVDALDSKGNTTLHRAAAAVSEFFPGASTPASGSSAIPENTAADYQRIFSILYEYGADPAQVDPNLGYAVAEFYQNYPVARFLVSK